MTITPANPSVKSLQPQASGGGDGPYEVGSVIDSHVSATGR